MRIDILTLFPAMFENVLGESMLKRAQDKGKIKVRIHDLRGWTSDAHRTADDRPFGGGPGMVMKVEPVYRALCDIAGGGEPGPRGDGQGAMGKAPSAGCKGQGAGDKAQKAGGKGQKAGDKGQRAKVILLTPQGARFDQKTAGRLARERSLVLICGHYEGVDERVRGLVDEEISIGDYILTCGEIPAMVLIDAVARLQPGVLGGKGSLDSESFENGLLEYPQYTRPADFNGVRVPDVLLSGDHGKIEEWRKRESLKRTRTRRPDLLKNG